MGRTRGKRAHAFQPERVPVGSSAEFAPQVSGSGECSSVLDGAFKGRNSFPPTAPTLPGEEEVRIPKVRVLGFPQNESAALVPLRPPEKHTGTSSGVSGFSLFPGGNRRESVTAE